jgi:hypothetical protein
MKVLLCMLAFSFSAFAVSSGSVATWQSFGGPAGESPRLTLLESDSHHMLVEITVPGFSLYDFPAGGSTWDKAELPGYYSQGDAGLPDLPSVTELFALPYGTEAVVTVESVTSTTYSNMDVLPRQTPEIDMDHAPFPFIMNDEFYGGTSTYPAVWATTDQEGGWAGLNVARLVVNPLRYNPATATLEAASSITLRVDFTGFPTDLSLPVVSSMVPAMERSVLNWDVFEAAADPMDGSRDDGVEYIFVCTEDNVDWVSELFETHHYLGLHTRIETLTAPATAVQIKNAIQADYVAGVTRFACVVGTYNEMPSYDYGTCVGDYYFSLMDAGNYPDLAVGRLTGDSVKIVHQVEKIIDGYMDYDFSRSNTPGIIPSETVLAAHEEDYPGKYTLCCNQVALYPYSLCDVTFTKIFPPEGGTRQDVVDAIEDGIGTVGYRGHGSRSAWQWSPGWLSSTIYALTNTYMPPVFNIACENGSYETPTTCISEAWQWADCGASGNLGATTASYTVPNHDYMKRIYRAMFDEGNFRVCEAIMVATDYVLTYHGALGLSNAKMYIWFGDPAMEVWSFDTAGQPGELEISHPLNILPGSQDITVTVTDGGSPVEGVNVTFTDGVDNYGSGMTFYEETTTNSSGEATVNVTVPASGNVYMGAFLHNYRYDIKWVLIGSGVGDTPEPGPSLHFNGILPNPVSTEASIGFAVPSGGAVRINVYDVSGRIVETVFDGQLDAGTHSVEWNPGNGLSSGVYFVRLDAGQGSVTARAMVIR